MRSAGWLFHKGWIIPISSLIFGITGLSIVHRSLKPSRQHEQEADLMAVERLRTAEGGIKYFEKQSSMLLNLAHKMGAAPIQLQVNVLNT